MYRIYSVYVVMGFLFCCVCSFITAMKNQEDDEVIKKDTTSDEVQEIFLEITKSPKDIIEKIKKDKQFGSENNFLSKKSFLKKVVEHYEVSEENEHLTRLVKEIFEINIDENNNNVLKGSSMKRISSLINNVKDKPKKKKLEQALKESNTKFKLIKEEEKYNKLPSLSEFFAAFWENKQEELLIFLKKNPKWADKRCEEFGYTPLLLAVKNSDHTTADYQLIRFLVVLTSYYLFKEDKNGCSPIDYAKTFVEEYGDIMNNISFALNNVVPDSEILKKLDKSFINADFETMLELIHSNPEIVKNRDNIYKQLNGYSIKEEELQNELPEEKEKRKKREKRQQESRKGLLNVIKMLDPMQQNMIDTKSKKTRTGLKNIIFFNYGSHEIKKSIGFGAKNSIITDKEDKAVSSETKKNKSLYDLSKRLSIVFSKNNNNGKKE